MLLIDLPVKVGVSINNVQEVVMLLYPLFPARSEALSALPDAPVVPDRPPRRRLRLPVAQPLRWRLAISRATSGRLTRRQLTGART